MNEVHTITFTLRAKTGGQEVTPATITLPWFNKFNREVEDFLAGSGRKVPLDEATVSIEKLIAFIGEGPSYNEDDLNTLIEKGTKAWADVPDSVVWVREQRGAYDE